MMGDARDRYLPGCNAMLANEVYVIMVYNNHRNDIETLDHLLR